MRLAALNHGTIRSRIPGREHQVVAQKLRTWAGIVGEIRVSEEPTNPTVSLQLSGVDTEAIIESAKSYDNVGIRQFKIRQMLFQSLGIPEQDEMFMSHTFLWRGAKRSCDLLFTNVRTLPDESLRSRDDWKLIIDFPFDSEGHSPDEDLDRLDKFRDKNERQRTLVWLPSFFSTRTQAELGKLVIIDRLLLGNNLDQHAKHLSAPRSADGAVAPSESAERLAHRLMQAIEAAYAIRSEPTPGTLDPAYDMSESHFQSLFPTLVLQRPVGANLGEALEHCSIRPCRISSRNIRSSDKRSSSAKTCGRCWKSARKRLARRRARVFVEDKAVRQKLINICNPLELGKIGDRQDALRPGAISGKTTSTGCSLNRGNRIRPWPTCADGPISRTSEGCRRRSRTC